MSEEMLDYGEMKNNLLVYKSKEQIADICIAHYKEIERLYSIIKEVREYINSIDEIEVRYLNKEALYRNNITEYQIQEQLKKDKTLEGHFVKVNKYYLLEILDKEKE